MSRDEKARARLRKWVRCHRERPEVYALFDQYARELLVRGRKRYSMDMIWQRMRWHSAVSTDEIEYKLSDGYRVFYGRYWLQKNPNHESFFILRRSLADGFDLIAEAGER